MNLAASVALRAYGTSEGVTKAWDSRGRGRHEQIHYQINPPKTSYETGKPINLIGYHNSNATDELRMGRRGIFFAEAPASDYGHVTHRAEIRMKNPFVAQEQVAAVEKLWPDKKDRPADINSTLESADMATVGNQDWWGTLDRGIAAEAKKRGYDGLIYTEPEALSLREYVVFDKANFNVGFVGETPEWIAKYPEEAKATSWAKYIKTQKDSNSMDLDSAAAKMKLVKLADVFRHRALAMMVKHMKLNAAAVLRATGTSEGAKKAWDTRGRGKNAKAKTAKPSAKQVKQAIGLYAALGTAIAGIHHKLEHPEEVKSVAGKFLHLLKSVGSWIEAGSALAGVHSAINAVMHSAAASHVLVNSLMWAHQQLLPVMGHIASSMNFSAEEIEAASQFGDTGWQYGRSIARSVGYVPTRTYGGFPTSGRGGHGAARVGHTGTGTMKRPSMPKPHAPKGPSVHRPNPSGHAGFNVRKPNISLHRLESEKTKVKQVKADIGGEPMTGNMGHAHIDPVVWFHPPSLTKRRSNESLRIPTDDPGETNDKFGDVTQRDDPKVKEMRMKLLKRSAPGGLPAQIPARTTLLAPHSGWYQPTGNGMYAAKRAARSARLGYKEKRGTFVSFANRGRI